MRKPVSVKRGLIDLASVIRKRVRDLVVAAVDETICCNRLVFGRIQHRYRVAGLGFPFG